MEKVNVIDIYIDNMLGYENAVWACCIEMCMGMMCGNEACGCCTGMMCGDTMWE